MKKFSIIVVAIIILIVVGFYCWARFNNLPAVVEHTSNDLDISSWKTYKNEIYGFEFKYPPNFSVDDKISGQSYNIMVSSPKTGEYASSTLGEMTDAIYIYPVVTAKDLHDDFSFTEPIEPKNFASKPWPDYAQLTYWGEVKSANRTGFKFSTVGMFDHEPFIVFKNNDDTWFEVWGLFIGEEPYDTIISTLKFNDSGWKTYRNEQSGFEFKYPPNLVAETKNGVFFLSFPPHTSGEEKPVLIFEVDPNPTKLTVQNYYDGDPGDDLMQRSDNYYSTTTVAGIEVFKFSPSMTFTGETVIIVPNQDTFIRIADIGDAFQANDLLNRILSTLKLSR